MAALEEICTVMENYVRKLHSLGLLSVNNLKIDRAAAKEIYDNEFRLPKTGFGTFLYAVHGTNAITKKTSTFITFNSNALSAITGSKVNNVGAKSRRKARAKEYRRKKVLVSQTYAFKKEKQPVEVCSPLKCHVCNTDFGGLQTCDEHVKSSQHVLRVKYATNRRVFNPPTVPDIRVEVSAGFGCGIEDVTLEPHEVVQLKITNLSSVDYEVLDIVQLNTEHVDIIAANHAVPFALPRKACEIQTLTARVHQNESVTFPQVFRVRNAATKEVFELLKELRIHLCVENTGGLVKELVPLESYIKPKPVVVDYDDEVVVRGTKPAKGTRMEIKKYLKDFHVPPSVLKVLNNGMKKTEGMSPKDLQTLTEIKNLLNVPDRSKPLSPNNYTRMLEMLLFMEEHQMTRNIRDYDTDNQTLQPAPGFPRLCLTLEVPGLAEQRPSLIRGDSVIVKESGDSKVRYEGIVHAVQQTTVVLGFHRTFVDNVYKPGKTFTVFFTFNRYTLRVEHQAVKLTETHKIEGNFFPKTVVGIASGEYQYDWFDKNILSNSEQQQAVRHIVENTSLPAPYLLFGPPGTGKTMTVAESIKQVWKLKPFSKILVCAPSNSAADEVAKRLNEIPRTDMFRYFAPSYLFDSIPPEVRAYSNHCTPTSYFYPTMKYVCEHRIVITTLVNAAKLVNGGLPENHFEYIFIDESGHATESETLVPIAGILTTKRAGKLSGQVVLAGDPQQLGPIIHSTLAKDFGFGTSMLERMMNTLDLYKRKEEKYNPSALTKLIRNYRSHPAILELPNRLFYDSELVSKGGDFINAAIGWEHLPNRNFPIIFHSVTGLEEREKSSPSFFNIQEILTVTSYLERLVGARLQGRQVEQKDIAVIAPYRRQVRKIQTVCAKKRWADLTVGSVEQLQGQERLVVIVSTVRSQATFLKLDNKFRLGFLNSPKRFNVAVTRAKALLIVIGNPNILQYDCNWNKFIKYCIDNGGFIGSKPIPPDDIEEVISKMDKLAVNGTNGPLFDFQRV